MRLKRIIGPNKEVVGIKVLHAGPVQRFSPRLIQKGQAEKWLSLSGDKLTIHAVDAPVVYRVTQYPGNYYECVKEIPNG